MPRFFFHVDNGKFAPDPTGIDLPDLDAARVEAVRAAGDMIREAEQSFWEHGEPWLMHVTDDKERLQFTLSFGVKVPSGEARFIPERRE